MAAREPNRAHQPEDPSTPATARHDSAATRDREFIAMALTITLCLEFLLSTVGVLFFGVRTEVAIAVTAPLSAFVTGLLAFYFPRTRN